MPYSAYQRGRLFEYRVKRELEALGLIVFRFAKSAPFDLIAFAPNGRIYLVECKLGKRKPYLRDNQLALYEALREHHDVKLLLINSANKNEVLSKLASEIFSEA